MTRRLAIVVGWLAVGYLPLLALAWLLLRIPESNLLMLSASAALVLAVVAGAAWVESVAVLTLADGSLAWATLRRAARGILPFVAAALLFAALWWAVGVATAWWAGRRGEIDAWLIARFGWTQTSWVHAGARWALVLVRDVLGLSLAVALFVVSLVRRPEAGPGSRLRQWALVGFSPRQLAILLALIVLFAWLPWQAVYWRPAWLPPSSAEVVFVAAKLGLLYLLGTIGWALALLATIRAAGGVRARLS